MFLMPTPFGLVDVGLQAAAQAVAAGMNALQTMPMVSPSAALRWSRPGRTLPHDEVRHSGLAWQVRMSQPQSCFKSFASRSARYRAAPDALHGLAKHSCRRDGLRGGLQATIDEAKGVGIKTSPVPSRSIPLTVPRSWPVPSVDDWKKNAMPSNKCGAACKAAGMSFAYHNHNLEFRKIGDVLPYDLLLKETDPALVSMEMDIVGWWRAAPNRSPI